MATPRLTIIPTGLRHIAHAAVFAGAIALGTGVVGPAAVANAEWDIGKYDTCINAADKRFISGEISLEEVSALYMLCCVDSGGVVNEHQGCTAPPLYAEPQGPVAPFPTAASQPPGAPRPPVAPPPTVIGPG